MKAMILAAGRGERMRPLTDHTPKPLLTVHGVSLIERLIRQLVAGGFPDIVINIAHLGDLIRHHLGDGAALAAHLRYSDEGPRGLETGGGIARALPLLDSDPFLVVNGDIYTDFLFSALPSTIPASAHLVMVDNPPHHPDGDFGLRDGYLSLAYPRLTFAGIGLYRRALFTPDRGLRFPLGPLLATAAQARQATGEYYGGYWTDVGTPERLDALNGHSHG
ncbi:MAG: N-acetylmuramate alpha-1-phosphate uridylyltransferase MurU [Acidiferrobacter sp.]